MLDVEALMQDAIRHFWQTRQSQSDRQGVTTGVRDAGNRTAVTGGKHADGFVDLVRSVVIDAGVKDAHIHSTKKTGRTLPGYFRPAKEWDLVVVNDRDVIAVVEVKSLVGSFGNNANNRVEEAVGNGIDFWEAYSEGLYEPSSRPWLGYLFMLEEHPKSMRPTRRTNLQPFAVEESFNGLSYAKRLEEAFMRLVRKRLYDSVCFVMSNSETGIKGHFVTPADELSTKNFCRSLYSHASSFGAI